MVPPATLAATPAGSHRHHLAILFCDLSDSTRIAASMEPELYANLLQLLRDMLIEIVARHGGEIARIDGDGALCIFGYPESHEDAGRRATEAAIDLHAAAATLDNNFDSGGIPIRLHSGIHAGMVLLREGDIVRGRFEMLGDATNVAARLCDHGGSDEIIASEAALGADRYFFRSGPTRKVRIAGHVRDLAFFNIYGREPITTRFVARARQGMTPFAGRAAELARLRAWLADGHEGLMLVAGPPGIGKTRLLAEFLSEAATAGVAVHRSYCEAYLGARPLQPFTQIVRSITGDPATDLSDSVAAGRGAPVGSSLERAIEITRALIEGAGGDGPCIFVIDDWQWADGASREMLDALARGAPHIGFLLASRELDVRLKAAELAGIIEMPPLSSEEAQVAIAALLPSPDPFLALRIGEESGGSPLFIEELCHASLRGTGDMESAEPNAWLDMLIQARFADLPIEQAILVRAASVIGHMVPTWLFRAISGVGPDDPAIAELAEADFLFPGDVDGTLRFKHGLTRDAIYRAIDLKERQALHKRVVEALRNEGQRSGEQALLDALAYHYAASGDTERAVPYAIRAGDAALAAGALDRAQAHYRAAFEAVATQGNEGPLAGMIWPIVNKYGLACIVDPSREQLPVMREMARRLRVLDNAEALVRSEYWMGTIAYGLGEGKQAVVHQTAALRTAAELGQSRLIPQIELKLAQSLFAAGRYAEADALFQRVLDTIACKKGRIDDESHVYALCCHGFLHADRGDFAAAERRYTEADLVLGNSTPPVFASYLTQRSAVCLFRGEWREALLRAQHCLQAWGQIHARYQMVMSNALGAYAQWQLNRDQRAIETLVGAARWFASGGSQQRTSLVYGWLADIMAATRNNEMARNYAARAIARVQRAGDRLGEAMAYRAVARAAAGRGDMRLADRYLAAAYRSAAIRASPREDAQTRLCEAEIALQAGQSGRARPLLATAHAKFTELDMPLFARSVETMLTSSG